MLELLYFWMNIGRRHLHRHRDRLEDLYDTNGRVFEGRARLLKHIWANRTSCVRLTCSTTVHTC